MTHFRAILGRVARAPHSHRHDQLHLCDILRLLHELQKRGARLAPLREALHAMRNVDLFRGKACELLIGIDME